MSKYSLTLYGLKKYGAAESSQLSYTSGLKAWSYDYNAVELTWGSIKVDPLFPAPTHWKLVRSLNSVPESPDKATFLTGGLISNFQVFYTDTDFVNISNQEVYYSIWIYDGSNWINCGSDTAYVVGPTKTLTNYLRRLPAPWINDKDGVGDATGNPEDENQLVQVLSALMFEYDRLRVQTRSVSNLSDYSKLPSSLLIPSVLDTAMPVEPALGDTSHRSLYRVGHSINAAKGTTKGIALFSSALTHWGSKVYLGHNLLADFNDSSFEQSTGRWLASGCELTRVTYADSLGLLGSAEQSPQTPSYNTLFPVKATAFGVVTGSGSAATIELPGGISGVPVIAGEEYAFSGYFKFLDADGTVGIDVTWYTGTGSKIDTDTDLSPAAVSSDWSLVSKSYTSPELAKFCKVSVNLGTIVEDDRVLVDMVQVATAEYGVQYRDARVIKLQVDSDRINYLPNPGFENGVGSWLTKNADLVQDKSSPEQAIIFGTSVAKVTATADVPVLISDWVQVEPNTTLMFSAYVTSGSGIKNAVARIEFTTPRYAEDQVSILSDENGQYFPLTPYIVSSEPFEINEDDPTRVYVSAVSPALVPDNGAAMAKVSVYISDGVTDDVVYVDGCMLDRGHILLPYFQGNGSPAPTDPLTEYVVYSNDCRWEYKRQVNLVTNSDFDDTTGWSSNSGTTLSSESYATEGVAPYVGSYVLKVSRDDSSPAVVSTTVSLENPLSYGGEDYTLVVRVLGFTGDISLGDKTWSITSANSESWITLSDTTTTAPGDTTVDFVVTAAPAGSTAYSFYLDAAQVEKGRITRPFVDVNMSTTLTRVNASDPASEVHESYAPQTNGGRSYYWVNYYPKFIRLKENLVDFVPLGSSWEIVSGDPTPDTYESVSSILPAASFENSLRGWTGIDSSLTRGVSLGSHYEDYAVHGAGFATVTSDLAGSFGAEVTPVEVRKEAGYYLTVAVKPVDEDSIGEATLYVDWLDENSDVLWTSSYTAAVTETNRWTYLDLTDKNIHNIAVSGDPANIVMAEKAQIRVSYMPTTPAIGAAFKLDRVVFRQ